MKRGLLQKRYLNFRFVILFFATFTGCQVEPQFYQASDFEKVPKTDVHFHYDTPDPYFLKMAAGIQMRLVSPNVNSSRPIDRQLEITRDMKKAFPDDFAFFGTFSVDSFGTEDFVEKTIAGINECMEAGACGIKIWKNIGMVLKDRDGRYVMADDHVFDPVFKYLAENKIPVMGHLGEPRNCWLPLEQMTDTSNYRYYKSHPQYHMYMHPEAPSYEDQIRAFENLLGKNPTLDYTAAHLASLEWSVDELAKRLDKFPDLKVDVSARIAHLQSQSIRDREHVRDFLIRYQDRIMYGTDVGVTPQETDYQAKSAQLVSRWREHFLYLATDSVMKIKNLPVEVKGLQLPKEVMDKIYHTNADRFFFPDRRPR